MTAHRIINPVSADAIMRAVAMLFLLAGVGGLLAVVLLLRADAPDAMIELLRQRNALGAEGNASTVESTFRVVATFTFLLSAASLIAARGLWLRRQWARRLSTALAIVLGLWWGLATVGVVLSPWPSWTALGWNALGAAACAGVLFVLRLQRVRHRCA